MFRKVLVANRGEIAVRVIRGLRELGIASVAVYSDVDRGALHVRMADQAVHIGEAPAAESYLHIGRILDAAEARGADAIHPGYGFLSENADFAAACQQRGLVFIGPPAKAIRAMGWKTEARRLAKASGVPVIPGSEGPVSSVEEARQTASEAGYPVMLKAAAGGGGKGMRRVDREEQLAGAFREASSEALRAFGNGELYLEKLIERPRHVEVQVLGDRHGHMIHLGERECSLQRRHQKVIEECPSPLVARTPGLREDMGEAALRIARAAGYVNAGTVEFLVDDGGRFYFLEMNTRLQVEHPVTELVTGLDLVQWQVRIAAGEPLAVRQQEIAWRGWAMECRVYAEDPDNQFYPSPGWIRQIETPAGAGVRLDSGVYPGWRVPLEYDPLLAKLAVWAGGREEATARMLRALEEYYIAGIKTNISFFRQILVDPAFRRGELHTGFIDEYLSRHRVGAPSEGEERARMVAAVVAALHREKEARERSRQPAAPGLSAWLREGRERLMR